MKTNSRKTKPKPETPPVVATPLARTPEERFASLQSWLLEVDAQISLVADELEKGKLANSLPGGRSAKFAGELRYIAEQIMNVAVNATPVVTPSFLVFVDGD